MSGLVAIAWVVSAATSPSQQAGGQAILERSAALYREMASVCADFVQEIRIPLLREVRTTRGRLCQQRPDRFAMRFSDPAGDVVLSDGEYFWVYYPSADAGQVIRSRSTEVTGGLDFHREFLENPAAKYTVRLEGQERVERRSAYVLELVPRVEAGYERVRLWIDAEDLLVRRLEIREENGNERRLDLTRIEPNASVPTDFFRFVPPAGVRVLDRPRSLSGRTPLLGQAPGTLP
ncbi:MAG: outer membrane lipoprotein carrier protein LolA [Gemmatimonadetes bacterium]|nr:outer membrane lipoprotein carrier protein LolA [Gemmatimonadota bacterium]